MSIDTDSGKSLSQLSLSLREQQKIPIFFERESPMTIHLIDPEHASDTDIRCGHCWDNKATLIELSANGEHNPDDHLVLCSNCAKLSGLKPCCECDKGPKVTVLAGHLVEKLRAIYAPDGLDGEGHCSWHIGMPVQPEKVKPGLNMHAG
ncbi:hypothetical protein [Pseudomonas sp. CCNWLW23]|uniref:hypothetical protein n=1 Tax=Pseudomonas sp. CCNWLW23 TaxID=3126385 RepID=UPI003012F587